MSKAAKYGFQYRDDHGVWSASGCGQQDASNLFDDPSDAEAELPRVAAVLGCNVNRVAVVQFYLETDPHRVSKPTWWPITGEN